MMGVLHIENMDDTVVSFYANATTEEKGAMQQVLKLWIRGDPMSYENLIVKQDSKKNKAEASVYADNHPLFPLSWSQNKLTREEMNER